MWKVPSLTRPSTWSCLLGSVLALVAFFLPCYTPPPDSSLPPASLGNCLTPCDGLDLLIQQNTGFGVVAVGAGLLLLLLLGILVLVVLAQCQRSPRWNVMERLLSLTSFTLIGYTLVSLSTLYLTLIRIEIASRSNEDPLTETLRLVGIGSLLIPAGLLLALIGGILLAIRKRKASD